MPSVSQYSGFTWQPEQSWICLHHECFISNSVCWSTDSKNISLSIRRNLTIFSGILQPYTMCLVFWLCNDHSHVLHRKFTKFNLLLVLEMQRCHRCLPTFIQLNLVVLPVQPVGYTAFPIKDLRFLKYCFLYEMVNDLLFERLPNKFLLGTADVLFFLSA